jgi:8-oxo-dGTP pyrophosphatase MutT (NUDIX family)
MPKLRNSTLLFLVKKSDGKISEICLAMKKRGFGMNRWNGVGGKVDENIETIEQAVLRETSEEISISAKNIKKVAELSFYFPHNPSWNQLVHTYIAEEWEGDPTESEEMRPEWFKIEEIPFKDMWPDDPFWLPEVLKGNLVKASFTFGEGDSVQKKEVNIVSGF